MQLTPTFGSLLLQFRSVFTAPTFATFLTIATGWCLSPRRRYVTELIQSAGAVRSTAFGVRFAGSPRPIICLAF